MILEIICGVIALICIVKLIVIVYSICTFRADDLVGTGILMGLGILLNTLRIGFYTSILIIDFVLYGGIRWW